MDGIALTGGDEVGGETAYAIDRGKCAPMLKGAWAEGGSASD
jgi:hypothetical protein